MPKRTKRKVTTRRPVKRTARRRESSAPNRSRLLGRLVLPLATCVGLVICLGAIGYLGYQRAAASNFFDVKTVDVTGVARGSRQGIESVVRTDTERTGVLRTDLFELKARIEKLPFVKTAAVTRVLPTGIRVQIVEREPKAIVFRSGRLVLVDGDGQILADAVQKEDDLPFTIIGWDEGKTEKAIKDNQERVKIYQRMLTEFRVSNLLSKVQSVDLTDLRDPRALVSDSGTTVSVGVGRENYGDNLMKGIKAIVGKGNTFAGVNLVNGNMILVPRKQD